MANYQPFTTASPWSRFNLKLDGALAFSHRQKRLNKLIAAATIALAIITSSLLGTPARARFYDQTQSQAPVPPDSEPDRSDLIRLPDLNNAESRGGFSNMPASNGQAFAPLPAISPLTAVGDPVRAAPLAWRASAYSLSANKLTAKAKWVIPASFDKTKSYLSTTLSQLGFVIKSAYPQAGQFLVVPIDKSSSASGQIIIVAQPNGESETALQMLTTGDWRSPEQQKVQQIPQVMLMVVQRRGLL